MKLAGSIVSFFKELSVEPIIFLLYFALFAFGSTTSNLYLQKTCMPTEPKDTNAVCEDPDSISASAGISTMRSCLKEGLTGVVVLIAGGWKDRTGLIKPLLILGLCGEILSAIVVTFGSFFWSTSSWIVASAECLIAGLTGGQRLFGMASNCYIMDNSTNENRTSKFSRLVAAMLLSGVVASASGGPILAALGYRYFFPFIIMLYITALFMVMFFIKDKPTERKKGPSLFSVATFKFVFRCGGNNAGIWMTIAASGFINVVLIGEGTVYLYYLQQLFKFSVTEAGYYVCFRTAVPAVSSIFIAPLLIKFFKVGDCKVAGLSALTTLAGAVAMVFASNLYELIFFTFFEVLKPNLLSSLRSILSKLLKPEESGVYFGLESVLTSLLPSVFLPFYNWTFSETLTTLPGAFYFVSAGLEFIIFLIACGVLYIYGEPGTVQNEVDIESESKPEEDKHKIDIDESQINDPNPELILNPSNVPNFM